MHSYGQAIKATLIAAASLAVLAAPSAATPVTFETGTYHLGNHPDGNAAPPTYGARIDNLFDGVSPFTFDFECGGCAMFMEYDGSSIRIHGDAFGGHPDGEGGYEDDEFDGLYAFDVTYDMASVVEDDPEGAEDGLQDIGRLGETGAMIGTLEFATPFGAVLPPAGTVMMWDLMDKQGPHPFSLRVGDEDDDMGHRGFPGISGWGWLMFRESGTDGPFIDADGSQDFIFTARRRSIVPAPPSAMVLALGLVALVARRRTR